MRRALSVTNVLEARFNTLQLTGQWLDAIGCPELSGSWFIYGPIKNGKTDFAMKLAKYLTEFGRVAYNSVEEGLSLSIQDAYRRNNMDEVKGKFILLDKEGVPEMAKRLKRHKSPDIWVVDTVQFLDLKFSEYKTLKLNNPNKLFIYVSHIDGRLPDGSTARKIHRDANVAFRVEGFRAFPVGRYGGGKPITICPRLAGEYWGLDIDEKEE